MCEQCYKHYGSPTIQNDKVKAAVKLIGKVYEHNGAGGNLHAILDDWNIEDDYFDWFSLSDPDVSEDQIQAEKECFNAMSDLTIDERASALHFHWFGGES